MRSKELSNHATFDKIRQSNRHLKQLEVSSIFLFPFRDDNPSYSVPMVTISLVCLNVIFYILSGLAGPYEYIGNVYTYGLIPAELFHGQIITSVDWLLPGEAQPTIGNFPTFLTLFTHMFMHGGFMHLLGNIWFLWLFGDNIEDRMGSFRFIIFYLVAGLIAALSHGLTDTSGIIPMIGASGAISGVIGAYIILFPYARIHTVLFVFFFFRTIRIPAWIFLGFWFVGQVFYGFQSLGVSGAGVAFFAHIGGFIAGVIMVKLFAPKQYVQVIGSDGRFHFTELNNIPEDDYYD